MSSIAAKAEILRLVTLLNYFRKHPMPHKTADLWFHSMVVLSQAGIRPEEVLQELARREGTSGLVEKANRKES